MSLYQEPPETGNPYRETFLAQVEALLDREFAAVSVVPYRHLQICDLLIFRRSKGI